jgi:hypothetical protein
MASRRASRTVMCTALPFHSGSAAGDGEAGGAAALLGASALPEMSATSAFAAERCDTDG